MGLIKGKNVILMVKTQSGTDAFNRPVYTETEVQVENVLIGHPTTEDIVNATDLYGKRLEYILGIPKGDTHNWENTKVKFFGKTFRTFGYPIEGIEENIPLSWHKKIMVEAFE